MIVFEIDSTQVKEKSGVGEKTGKPYCMRFQQVSITGLIIDGFPARFPRETTIQLEDDAQPYAVGRYTIAPDSFFFGDFGRFTLGRIKLIPLKDYLADMQRQLGITVSYNQPKAA